jgi:hypothetical protein
MLLIHINKTLSYTRYLSNSQWLIIRNILKNYHTHPSIKSRVNYILYKKYYEYTINKAYSFSKYNKICCNKKISAIDLSNYALRGLYKAVINYNATYTFANHLDLYIQYELYKGYKDLYPINDIVSYIQNNKKNKNNINNNDIIISLKETFIKDVNNHDDSNLHYDEIDITSKLKNMGASYYKIYKLKYNNINSNKLSNKQIGQLMSCSEETIRCKLKRIHNIIE